MFKLQLLTHGYIPGGGGGGGGFSDISYIRRLGSFFGVQNFEFQYFWGVLEKNNIFWV